MLTYGEFVDRVLESLGPEGKRQAILPIIHSAIRSGLIDLQRYAPALQTRNVNYFTKDESRTYNGITVLENVQGCDIGKSKIIRLRTLVAGQQDVIIEHLPTTFTFIDNIARRIPYYMENSAMGLRSYDPLYWSKILAGESYVEPDTCTNDLCLIPTQSYTSRTFSGYFSKSDKQIFVFPEMRPTDVIQVQWSGIKTFWRNSEEVVFGEEHVSAIVYKVFKELALRGILDDVSLNREYERNYTNARKEIILDEEWATLHQGTLFLSDNYLVPEIKLTTPTIEFNADKLPVSMIQHLSFRGTPIDNPSLIPNTTTIRVPVPDVFYSAPGVKCTILNYAVKDEVTFGGVNLTNPMNKTIGDLRKFTDLRQECLISVDTRLDGTKERTVYVTLNNRETGVAPGYDITVQWEAILEENPANPGCYTLDTVEANSLYCPTCPTCPAENPTSYNNGAKDLGALIASPTEQYYILEVQSKYKFDILTLSASTKTGTLKATVLVNDTPVTGLTDVDISSTPTMFTSTTNKTCNIGDRLVLRLHTLAGTPTDFSFNLKIK